MIIVIGFTINSVLKYRNNTDTEQTIKLKQIYSSDYNLIPINDNYYIGSYKENEIDVIIDNNGKEVYKAINEIPYEKIYRMKDGRFLIYSNINNTIVTSVFDGEKVTDYYQIPNIEYAKPILYKGLEYEYILGFYDIKDNNLYLYNINNQETIEIKNSVLITDSKEQNAFYINSENYLAIKDENEKIGIVDFQGQAIIECQYTDIISTKKDKFIVKTENNKYGIIDKNNNILLKTNYKVIKNYEEYYIVVNNSNKMALYDDELNNLTGFVMDYDPLIEYDPRNTDSIYINKLNGNLLIANNYHEDQNGTEYSKHNLYIINNNKVWSNITQKGFFTDSYLYTYNNVYTISVYDENYEKKSEITLSNPSKIENISTTTDNVIEIIYVDEENVKQTKYYNFSGEEINNEYQEYGELLHSNYIYNAYIKNDKNTKELTLFTVDHKSKTSITGTSIELVKDYIIIDNAIYKIEVTS